MENIDIKNIVIRLNIPEVLNAVKSERYFEIDINGKLYVDERAAMTMPLVYRHKRQEQSAAIVDATVIIKELFKAYKPDVKGAMCTITPLIAWQEVIDTNKDRMLYFDHQSDGVELFEDKVLEDMGWEATALDITYREISETIEKECEGCLVFYDNGIQFNGFVIVNDIESVREKVKEFIVNRINEKLQADELDRDDTDVEEALEFFGVNS